jgi:alkyl hydroperoxide reductase subunit AhpC
VQCRFHVGQLGRYNDEFNKAGFQTLVILGESLERAISYRDSLKVPFPILADPERGVYHRFEMTKNFIGLQRTASLVIDEDGEIRYLKRVYNPMTWLQESQEIVQVVRNWPAKK